MKEMIEKAEEEVHRLLSDYPFHIDMEVIEQDDECALLEFEISDDDLSIESYLNIQVTEDKIFLEVNEESFEDLDLTNIWRELFFNKA